MWTFTTLLPLIIGDLIPDNNTMSNGNAFAIFLNSQICSSIVITTVLSCTLKPLTEQHEQFRQCYHDVSITPKMHYMVHFPR